MSLAHYIKTNYPNYQNIKPLNCLNGEWVSMRVGPKPTHLNRLDTLMG